MGTASGVHETTRNTPNSKNSATALLTDDRNKLREVRQMKAYLASYFWDSGSPDEEDEFKLIGIYSSEEKAQAAIDHARLRPGFSTGPGDLQVSPWIIEQTRWDGGFVTWAEALDKLRQPNNKQ